VSDAKCSEFDHSAPIPEPFVIVGDDVRSPFALDLVGDDARSPQECSIANGLVTSSSVPPRRDYGGQVVPYNSKP